MSEAKTIVFLFRYGAGEHADFMPALPELCRKLTEQGWTVEHLGCKSDQPEPPELLKWCKVETLPIHVHRSSGFDKWWKAFLWLLWLPVLGRRLQRRGVHTVFMDETLPLTVGAFRKGFKGRLCTTFHDQFTAIYFSEGPLRSWLERKDREGRRRVDLLFPRVEAGKAFLMAEGIPEEKIHVVPDSVDTVQ